ncbi:MAG TPA: hypothetical protein PK509_09325 [Catalimonadaceae bacterium]|nr:hypothetical protein [Catalimonadaceae bacterium]
MKKHTLIALGLLFLSQWVQAQNADSTLRNLASQKMKVFAGLLRQMAATGLDISTKNKIERTIEADFLADGEVYLYNDLNNQFGVNPKLGATPYFAQLKALYPNGAHLQSSDFESSDIFFNEARDMYYIIFRTQRSFSGLNALAKKEVNINKVIDYQFIITEKGQLVLDIAGGWEAEGPVNTPLGLDRSLADFPGKKVKYSGNTVPEEFKIEEAKKLLTEATRLVHRYEELEEVKADREETPGERKQRKAQAKAEKARLQRELKKAESERNSLTTNRLNIRLGFGFHVCDSVVNNMPGRIRNFKYTNWMAKADLQYKFTGVERLPDGKWQKAHTVGLFMNYGKQTGSNINHMTRVVQDQPSLDTTKPARGFFEAEMGVMLREEFRLSGGMGFMNYHLLQDGVEQMGSKSYYSFTAGLSPRLFSFLEMDFNVTGLLIDGVLKPRANVNMVLLFKARKK